MIEFKKIFNAGKYKDILPLKLKASNNYISSQNLINFIS